MGIKKPPSHFESNEAIIRAWDGALIKGSKRAIFVAKFGLLTEPCTPLVALVDWPERSPGHVILEFCSPGMVTILKSRKERHDDIRQFYIDNLWALAGLSNNRIASESFGIDDPEKQRIKLVEMLKRGWTRIFSRLFLPGFHLKASSSQVTYGPTYGSNSIASLVISPHSNHEITDRSMIIKLIENLHSRFAIKLSPYQVTDFMEQMQELI